MKYKSVFFIGGQEDGKWHSVLEGVQFVIFPKISGTEELEIYNDGGSEIKDRTLQHIRYKRVLGIDLDTYVLDD